MGFTRSITSRTRDATLAEAYYKFVGLMYHDVESKKAALKFKVWETKADRDTEGRKPIQTAVVHVNRDGKKPEDFDTIFADANLTPADKNYLKNLYVFVEAHYGDTKTVDPD